MKPTTVVSYSIISIGTLAANPLWDEKVAVRTAHATTTLIMAGAVTVLVNPSLPSQALVARMSERTRMKPSDITHVFLTSLESDHRRALAEFSNARWLVHEPEREAALADLHATRQQAEESDDRELLVLAERDLALVERCETAEDSIAPHVDLFPLPGVTAGTCGLLLSLPGSTVLITGDAVATAEHLEQGKVLPHCQSLAQAQESFKEAIEIADILIPGRDNLVINPLRRI
jgi:glyoxylase-like metal-dependent hydrolase (beta-lactamase superfamily II)